MEVPFATARDNLLMAFKKYLERPQAATMTLAHSSTSESRFESFLLEVHARIVLFVPPTSTTSHSALHHSPLDDNNENSANDADITSTFQADLIRLIELFDQMIQSTAITATLPTSTKILRCVVMNICGLECVLGGESGGLLRGGGK